MQSNQNIRAVLARFDLARILLVIVAAAALVVTFIATAPVSHGATAGSKSSSGKVVQRAKPSISAPKDVGKNAPRPSVGGPVGSISPPLQIASDCSVDVSAALQSFLTSLPTGSVVYSPAGSCYLIDQGINLVFPHGITIDGGEFLERTNGGLRRAAFDLVGGNAITFENLQIVGPNVKVMWNPNRAFQSGIELQGTEDATISHVHITDVYGDGITLNPLRGSADHMSGKIIRPVENINVDNVYINGAGRQGISPVSVTGGTFTNISFHDIHWNAFDFEADQANEGAENVVVNGCTVVQVNTLAAFRSNAAFTGPVTIENCTMPTVDGGDAVYIKSATNRQEHGPITFTNDSFTCPPLAPVPCFRFQNAYDVVVSNSTVRFASAGRAAPTEAVYWAYNHTHANFVNDTVSGYGRLGWHDQSSSVSVSQGAWGG